MVKMAVDSNIMLFSLIEEALWVWRHHGTNLWSPLQDLMWTPISSNHNLLPVAQLLSYMQMYSWCGTGLQEPIQQDLQQNETYHLLHLNIPWCQNSMEASDSPPQTQTSHDIGINGIMELDPGPMENDDHSNRCDPKNCDTGTMCYGLVPLPLCCIWPYNLCIPTGTSGFPSIQAQG
jgi:hypothetical protein